MMAAPPKTASVDVALENKEENKEGNKGKNVFKQINYYFILSVRFRLRPPGWGLSSNSSNGSSAVAQGFS